MNRRTLLKGIFGLMALFPIVPLIKKNESVDGGELLAGIDKAKPGESQTTLILCDPLSDQEFHLMKNSFGSTVVNCHCAFEYEENNETF